MPRDPSRDNVAGTGARTGRIRFRLICSTVSVRPKANKRRLGTERKPVQDLHLPMCSRENDRVEWPTRFRRSGEADEVMRVKASVANVGFNPGQ